MKKYIQLLSLLIIGAGLSSCLDVVDVNVPKGERLLAVEGMISNQPGPYTIKLSYTSPYFDQSPNEPAIGAVVKLKDNEGFEEVLVEEQPGEYVATSIQGKIGNKYFLYINHEEEEYEAETEVKRVPPIDSLTFEFKKAIKDADIEEGYILKYYGPEPEGVGDFYRFRTYKNGILFNKPSDLAFTNDELVDGNYIADVELSFENRYQPNDTVKAETMTINEDAYHFFLEMFIQINNADAGLFANPVANVRTNVKNLNPNSKKRAVGYFYGAGISTIEGIFLDPKGVIK